MAETSLWVGRSLTRPDEVSVLNKAAGLWTLRVAGRVVSGLKRNSRPRDAMRAAVNAEARVFTADACCAGQRAELKKCRRHRTAPCSAVIGHCGPCRRFQGSDLAAETDYPVVRCLWSTAARPAKCCHTAMDYRTTGPTDFSPPYSLSYWIDSVKRGF